MTMKLNPVIEEIKQRFKNHPHVEMGERIFMESANKIGHVGDDGSLQIGNDCIFWDDQPSLHVFGHGKLKIGNRCTLGTNNQIYCREEVLLGDYVMTSRDLTIYDYEAHPIDPELRKKQIDYMTAEFNPFCSLEDTGLNDDEISFFDSYWDHYDRFPHAPVKIGNNVWIGFGVSIFKGVSIGDHCIIAANSIVTRDIPDNCIAAGTPAKPVKKI